jgi:hypothetical protein
MVLKPRLLRVYGCPGIPLLPAALALRGLKHPNGNFLRAFYVVLFCGLDIAEADFMSASKAPHPQIPPSLTPGPPHKHQKRSAASLRPML